MNNQFKIICTKPYEFEGTIFNLGDIRTHCAGRNVPEDWQRYYIPKNSNVYGNSLHLMNDIKDKSVDLICADLPQAITKNKWDVIIPFDKMWEQYERIIKDNGAIVLFGNQPFTSQLIVSNLKLFKYSLVWEKTTSTGFFNAKKMPLRSHEDILVFYKKPPTYNPQKTTGNKRKVSTAVHKRNSKVSSNYGQSLAVDYDSTERYPKSVWKFPTDKQKSALHPTQKPVPLIEEIIKTYTNEGDTVLDNCAGSGTTAIACINTNRNYILMESDFDMFKVASERIRNHKQQKSLTNQSKAFYQN